MVLVLRRFSAVMAREVVETVIEAEGWEALGLAGIAERAARATLRHLGLEPERYEIALLGCDDARIASLNAEFRGRRLPTNVLSWPSEERQADPGTPPEVPEPGELGDIAIAFEICRAEAEAGGKRIEDHATHLMVHAVLHLLGYDHETEPDAELMERTEAEVLAGLGLHDPYA